MNSRSKRRIEKLEHEVAHACDGPAAKIRQAVLSALDIDSLEQLNEFLKRGGHESDATEQEKLALQRYNEVYQAEAVRISGQTLSELRRAGLVPNPGRSK